MLKPGGCCIMTFSNRLYYEKVLAAPDQALRSPGLHYKTVLAAPDQARWSDGLHCEKVLAAVPKQAQRAPGLLPCGRCGVLGLVDNAVRLFSAGDSGLAGRLRLQPRAAGEAVLSVRRGWVPCLRSLSYAACLTR